VNVRIFARIPIADDSETIEWIRGLETESGHRLMIGIVGRGVGDGGGVIGKIEYWKHVQDVIKSCGQSGDVLWIRNLSTALLSLPGLTRWLPGRRGMRYVYDASSMLELESGLGERELIHRAQAALERRIRPQFDIVRTLGNRMRSHLIQSGVDPDRIVVAPVGAEPPIEPPRVRTSVRRLLYIGSATRWQGLPYLLDAMEILDERAPHVSLSLVGREDAFPERVRDQRNIQLLGWRSRSDMPAVYDDHDLFVIPRPRLPLTQTVVPMKCAEAQAHGIPILSTRLDAILEVTGEDGAFFVTPESPTAIADTVCQLVDDPTPLAKVTAASQNRRHDFSWSKIAEDLVTDLFGQDG
jgi:glycosyltransferase involved in cell wall biosynthesis